MANFLWGSAGQKMSPAQVAEQRKIAQALMAEASDTSPVGHWTAALNRGLQGYLGGRQAYQAREAENAGRAGLEAKRAGQANAATFGGADPVAAALSGGAGLGNYAVPAGGDVATSLFPASLIETESGGNWNALNNEGYGGRLQFGAARLADAANAGIIPAGIDGAAFSRLPPEQQMAVENWHFQDIENQARRMGLDQYVGQTVAGVPIDMNAIKGMAHLGGIGGAAKFLQSGGQYNPADSNGTSLAAYGRRHGGGAAPAQSGGMSNIAALLADEWLPESERAVLQAQYESQLKQQDPMYQAQYEAQVLANQAARQPQAPKPIEVGGVLLDPNTYQPIFDSREQKAGYTQLTPEQATQFGLDPSRQWQVSGDNKIEPIGGSPLVQNNIGGEKQWDQESAKLWAKRYDGMVGGASNARDMLSMYDLAESAINSGVRTGFGASQEQALRKMAAGLGIGAEDAEKLAGGELLNTVQNRMALMMRNPDGGMGMPGAMSDADRKFLSDSQVGLDRTPEGNRKMLAAFRAMEQRKIEISELADQYITENGMLDQGFNKIVKGYAEANPMFKVDDAQTGAPARINSKAEFDALPSGATFIAPDGTTRRKP